VYWVLRRRPAAPDVRGTSSTPASGSAPLLARVKQSTSTPTMMKGKAASRSEVVLSTRIGVVEGEAERGRSVETGVGEEVVEPGDEVPTASLPSVPLQLQLVRLCIGCDPSLIGSYYRQLETLASSLSPVQHPACG